MSEAVYSHFEQLCNGFLDPLNLDPLPGTFLGYWAGHICKKGTS